MLQRKAFSLLELPHGLRLLLLGRPLQLDLAVELAIRFQIHLREAPKLRLPRPQNCKTGLTQISWTGWSSLLISSARAILQLAMKSSGGMVASWNTVNPMFSALRKRSVVNVSFQVGSRVLGLVDVRSMATSSTSTATYGSKVTVALVSNCSRVMKFVCCRFSALMTVIFKRPLNMIISQLILGSLPSGKPALFSRRYEMLLELNKSSSRSSRPWNKGKSELRASRGARKMQTGAKSRAWIKKGWIEKKNLTSERPSLHGKPAAQLVSLADAFLDWQQPQQRIEEGTAAQRRRPWYYLSSHPPQPSSRRNFLCYTYTHRAPNLPRREIHSRNEKAERMQRKKKLPFARGRFLLCVCVFTDVLHTLSLLRAFIFHIYIHFSNALQKIAFRCRKSHTALIVSRGKRGTKRDFHWLSTFFPSLFPFCWIFLSSRIYITLLKIFFSKNSRFFIEVFKLNFFAWKIYFNNAYFFLAKLIEI